MGATWHVNVSVDVLMILGDSIGMGAAATLENVCFPVFWGTMLNPKKTWGELGDVRRVEKQLISLFMHFTRGSIQRETSMSEFHLITANIWMINSSTRKEMSSSTFYPWDLHRHLSETRVYSADSESFVHGNTHNSFFLHATRRPSSNDWLRSVWCHRRKTHHHDTRVTSFVNMSPKWSRGF